MQGKHSAEKSKVPVIIICAAVVAVIAIVGILLFVNFNSSSNTQSTVQTHQTTQPQLTDYETQQYTTQTSETTSQSKNNLSAEGSETQKVIVPTNDSIIDKVYYFSGTYSPYKAIDSETGNSCSLKEVFGSSYSGGSIIFNNDGTFSDTLSISSVNSGAYTVDGDKIKATYTNDKNVSVTVLQWNGDVPAEIIINYGGYDVYFN